ncbi:MAG TPA: gamma-glutamyltransferase family protein [Candidatus Baltobacteraceae bacterium]|nr:gamma-glutamyltransferase family protein [Candidatus Baltobacteraceae bacterium]
MSTPLPWPSRAVARSTRAMVVSPHPLATAAGVAVLARGGNAVDAAIAANAVLAVVYPASCGLGGDALWMVHDPVPRPTLERRTTCYNGTGRTPRAASLDRLGGELPARGALTVTVPGAVRSWEDVARAHGTRGLDELLLPAEQLAHNGFAVTDVVAAYFALNEALLREDAEATRIFFRDGVPRAGDVLRNPDLAATLQAIRRGGADAFYAGSTAEAIVATLRPHGNAMTLDDLATHRTERAAPLALAWNGGELLAHPPNSQGAVLLLAEGMLAGDAELDEPAWAHVAIEAMKRALTIRDERIADPAYGGPVLDGELDRERLLTQRARIDPERAVARTGRTDGGDTIAICVVDEDGMAVTLIESLYMNFGSGIVAGGTGVVLHNRGACFSLRPGHPNAYDGGKRPVSTLSPAMFLRDGEPEIVFGTMGGDAQPQIQAQVLHQLVDRGLDVQRAIDAPRWVYGRPLVAGRPELRSDAVLVESRTPRDVVDALERRGHEVIALGPYENAMGHGHAIVVDPVRGTLAGGADPRADSLALGL